MPFFKVNRNHTKSEKYALKSLHFKHDKFRAYIDPCG